MKEIRMSNVPKSPNGEYNYHTWSQFMVKTPKEMPTESHFAGVMFDRVGINTGYPEHPDEWTVTDYFAFPDREHLEAWVSEAAQAKKTFFFFRATVGTAKVKVNVDIGFDDTNP